MSENLTKHPPSASKVDDEGEDGKVGYRRPPKHSRFTKGRSGNPGGRKKKTAAPEIGELLHDVLAKPITITENGRAREVSMLEAVLLGSLARMAKRDLRDLPHWIKLLGRYPRHPKAAEEAQTIDWGREVRRRLEEMAERMEQEKAAGRSIERP